MIYFDNAATGGEKPTAVRESVKASIEQCANAGRSGHRRSTAILERTYACRKLLCEFFGGYSFDRTIFTKNCTEALNIALLGVLRRGDKVVTTVAEHNSVLRPLEWLKRQGVEVEYAPLDEQGQIDVKALLTLVHGDTRAVVVTLASNVTGTAPDLEQLHHGLPRHTLLICDGAQACGHIPIDMQRQGIDVLAVAGHKGMLGIQGSGALLFSERVNPQPLLFGGTGSESYSLTMPEFYPDRLESGTIAYPAICSLMAGTIYLQSHFYEMKDKLEYLTKQLVLGLQKIPDCRLYSQPNPFGIVAFALQGKSSEQVAYRLSEEYSICIRGGLHCAPFMHASLHSDGLARASLSAFNTEREVQVFLSAIRSLCC